jgi:cell division protein FtsB
MRVAFQVLLVAIILLLCFMLWQQEHTIHQTESVWLRQVKEYAAKNAILKTDNNRQRSHIDTLKQERNSLKSELNATLADYRKLAAADKIRLVQNVDSNARMLNDSTATVSIEVIDSFNVLNYSYQVKTRELAIADSIIARQDTIISNDSVMVNNLQASNQIAVTEAQQANKRAQQKAKAVTIWRSIAIGSAAVVGVLLLVP